MGTRNHVVLGADWDLPVDEIRRCEGAAKGGGTGSDGNIRVDGRTGGNCDEMLRPEPGDKGYDRRDIGNAVHAADRAEGKSSSAGERCEEGRVAVTASDGSAAGNTQTIGCRAENGVFGVTGTVQAAADERRSIVMLDGNGGKYSR